MRKSQGVGPGRWDMTGLWGTGDRLPLLGGCQQAQEQRVGSFSGSHSGPQPRGCSTLHPHPELSIREKTAKNDLWSQTDPRSRPDFATHKLGGLGHVNLPLEPQFSCL